MGLNRLVNLGLAGLLGAGSVLSGVNVINMYSTNLSYNSLENKAKIEDGHELAITQDFYEDKQKFYAGNIGKFGSLAMIAGIGLYYNRRKWGDGLGR